MPAKSAAPTALLRSRPRPPRAERRARRAAGVEPHRPLSRHGRAGVRSAISTRAEAECDAFEEAYKRQARRPAARAATPARRSPRRSSATRRSRICSAGSSPIAGLVYAGDTTDPARAKFYGDVQERITAASLASAVLHARAQPHRRRACSTRRWRDPALGHYRPWIEDMRKEKPYQLEDRVEQLFHEKSVTGARRLEPAVRRDDRRRCASRSAARSWRSSRRSTCCRTPTRATRQAAAEALGADLQRESARLHADHQHARQGQGDLRPLARLRGRRRRAPSRQPGRARGGRRAGRRRARGLSAPVAPLLRAEGASGSARSACRTGTATRRCRRCRAAHHPLGRGARHGARRPMAASRRRWRTSPAASSTSAGSTRRCGPARRRAPSRIRPCRRRTPTCCSTTRASRAT